MRYYKFVLLGDYGKVTIEIKATNLESAISNVMALENCPECAIYSITVNSKN